jgi:phenylalanine-4-hydroxylase
VTGETDHKLRGDYSAMRPDYTVDLEWYACSEAEHGLWRRLYRRQAALVPKYACDEFREVLATHNFGAGIPRFGVISPMFKIPPQSDRS